MNAAERARLRPGVEWALAQMREWADSAERVEGCDHYENGVRDAAEMLREKFEPKRRRGKVLRP